MQAGPQTHPSAVPAMGLDASNDDWRKFRPRLLRLPVRTVISAIAASTANEERLVPSPMLLHDTRTHMGHVNG